MKRYACGLFLLLSACGGRVVVPPPPPPPAPTVRTVGLTVASATGPIAGAACMIDDAPAPRGVSDANGYVAWDGVDVERRDLQLSCTADGYQPFSEHRALATSANEDLAPATLTRLHVDPSTMPLEQLAAIRGAMWSARMNLPFGPRPNRDDNILALPFFHEYKVLEASIADAMLDRYIHGYRFTHGVTGPIQGNDCYHGKYPCRIGIPTQAEWDEYLDELQTWWDRGLVPVYFAKPDGWERPEHAAEMDALDALYRQPRAQQLLRVVVYPGWEPSGDRYGWSNAMYVAWARRGADVFPHALRLLHLVSDLDAPTGQNDDQIPGWTNGRAWQAVAPFMHGWLVQNAGYTGGSSPTATAAFLREFAQQFDPTVRGSLVERFTTGGPTGDWPRGSAWGSDQRLRVYAAEYAAFADFWQNWPEAEAFKLGDVAIAAGADGYLDGGTVAVPPR